MPKARKKPVVIDFEAFTEENKDRAFNFITCNKSADFDENGKPVIKIQTLEGVMTANIGDFIIKGVNGEFYPCKPDIFEKTYDFAGAFEEKQATDSEGNETLRYMYRQQSQINGQKMVLTYARDFINGVTPMSTEAVLSRINSAIAFDIHKEAEASSPTIEQMQENYAVKTELATCLEPKGGFPDKLPYQKHEEKHKQNPDKEFHPIG